MNNPVLWEDYQYSEQFYSIASNGYCTPCNFAASCKVIWSQRMGTRRKRMQPELVVDRGDIRLLQGRRCMTWKSIWSNLFEADCLSTWHCHQYLHWLVFVFPQVLSMTKLWLNSGHCWINLCITFTFPSTTGQWPVKVSLGFRCTKNKLKKKGATQPTQKRQRAKAVMKIIGTGLPFVFHQCQTWHQLHGFVHKMEHSGKPSVIHNFWLYWHTEMAHPLWKSMSLP